MEREACVCDHGYERSDLCAEIIIIIIIIKLLVILYNLHQSPCRDTENKYIKSIDVLCIWTKGSGLQKCDNRTNKVHCRYYDEIYL